MQDHSPGCEQHQQQLCLFEELNPHAAIWRNAVRMNAEHSLSPAVSNSTRPHLVINPSTLQEGAYCFLKVF